MATNLYPLNFKPGIKRDGTLFQADYCTAGQWVRFQRGYIKKIGGTKGGIPIPNAIYKITNLTFLPLTGNITQIGVYMGAVSGANSYIHYQTINQDFAPLTPFTLIKQIANQGNFIWCSAVVIQNNNQKIVFLGSPSSDNINSNGDATIAVITPPQAVGTVQGTPELKGLSGLLFSNPYLFIYGSNGRVQWSKATDPLDFRGNARAINISNDKVIHGASIRGGVNTPTILFWTLSSVVRCINTGANELSFQVDVLSKSSSILSSRCVVEWDGVFFWPGTNRFFHYNGVVQELPNPLNLNYFFNNLDMVARQQVFGVKNTKYGEIWWFYPEKATAPNRDNRIPNGENSRALIYNIRENTWYDTPISRTAGAYSEDYGFMSTAGRFLTNPALDKSTVWRHEYETFSNIPTAIMENPGLQYLNPNPIPSSFTTPTISWAAFNPMKQLTGVNRWMEVVTMEPDFTLLPANTDLKVVINSKEYAQDYGVSSQPFPIPALLAQGANPDGAKIDMAIQGRHITFSFDTTMNFEMGQVMVSLGIGDGQ